MLADEIIREAKQNAKEALKRAKAVVELERKKLEKELEELEKKKLSVKEKELEEREKEFRAALQLEKKKILQEEKETLFKKFLEMVSEEALNDEEFWKSLAKKAEEVAGEFPDKEFTIYVLEGRKKYFSALKNVKEDRDVLGFKIVSKDSRIEYDATIPVLIERKRNSLKKLFQKYMSG